MSKTPTIGDLYGTRTTCAPSKAWKALRDSTRPPTSALPPSAERRAVRMVEIWSLFLNMGRRHNRETLEVRHKGEKESPRCFG